MEEHDKDLLASLRIWALVFLYFAKPAIEKLGTEGEKALRKGLRAYAKFRGARMRKTHMDMGLPITLESARRYWDLSGNSRSGTVKLLAGTPIEHQHDPPNLDFICPMFEVCKEANFEHYGYIYCDEAHQENWRAYHPRGVVEIHENLMKGDPYCNFDWIINEIPVRKPSAYAALEKLEKENPAQFAMRYHKGNSHATAILYYFLADALISRFEEEGERIVKSALIELGRRRGRELKENLRKAGLAATWKSIFDNFDLPYKHVWKMNIDKSNGSFIAEVEYCPLAEVWNGLENKNLGPMYCDTMYKSMFKELLNEEVEIKIPQCLTKGASKCRFEFKNQS
jgi:predicted hydrocarbon binding protein